MTEKYNTKVRQAISDKYIECTKIKGEVLRQLEEIAQRLANEKDKLTYSEYLNLKSKAGYLENRIKELNIQIDIWDEAREICLNVADEVFK